MPNTTEIRTLKIYVSGLVAFVKESEKTQALLVSHHDHKPKLEIACRTETGYGVKCLDIVGKDLKFDWSPDGVVASKHGTTPKSKKPTNKAAAKNTDWLLRMKTLTGDTGVSKADPDLLVEKIAKDEERVTCRAQLRGTFLTARLAEWSCDYNDNNLRPVTLMWGGELKTAAASCLCVEVANPILPDVGAKLQIHTRPFGEEEWDEPVVISDPTRHEELYVLLSNDFQCVDFSREVKHLHHYASVLKDPTIEIPKVCTHSCGDFSPETQPDREGLEYFETGKLFTGEDALRRRSIFRPPICPGIMLE